VRSFRRDTIGRAVRRAGGAPHRPYSGHDALFDLSGSSWLPRRTRPLSTLASTCRSSSPAGPVSYRVRLPAGPLVRSPAPLDVLSRPLAAVSRWRPGTTKAYLAAVEQRREHFADMEPGRQTTVTPTANTQPLTPLGGRRDLSFALAAKRRPATHILGALLYEMAAMSRDDRLVMQAHPGIQRKPSVLCKRFSQPTGRRHPVPSLRTTELRPLLNAFGQGSAVSLHVSPPTRPSFSRRLAPLPRLSVEYDRVHPGWFSWTRRPRCAGSGSG